MSATAGRMRFRGVALEPLAPHQVASLGLARTFQTSRIFERVTDLEHLMAGQHLRQRAGLWAAIRRPAWVGREEAEARERGLKTLALFGDRLLPLRDRPSAPRHTQEEEP